MHSCTAICTQAATLGSEHDYAAAGAATVDATRTAVVGAKGCATVDYKAAAHANDGTAVADATRGAAPHAAGTAANEYDDATTAVWPADSI